MVYLKAVCVKQLLTFFMAFYTTSGTPKSLLRNTPKETLAFVTHRRSKRCPRVKLVGLVQGDRVYQCLEKFMCNLIAIKTYFDIIFTAELNLKSG